MADFKFCVMENVKDSENFIGARSDLKQGERYR